MQMRLSISFITFYGFFLVNVDAFAPPSKNVAPNQNGLDVDQKQQFTEPIIPESTINDDLSNYASKLSDGEGNSRRVFLSCLVGSGLMMASGEASYAADGVKTYKKATITESNYQYSKPNAAHSMSASSSELLSSAASAAATSTGTVEWKPILERASKKALGGGKAGASAAVVQVCSLMWLRTSMNYQYRYGGDLGSSLKTLWNEGGIARLYQGLPFALVQGPMTRFGDTAANVGILALLESTPETQSLPLPIKTACGSIAAGLWRIFLMPVDTSKTSMQVEGAEGIKNLWSSVAEQGPAPLYRGSLASAAATAVGHFPWFLTYNFLSEQLPEISSSEDLLLSLVRAAFIGLCASCVSDCASNSLRVIKTTKQTASLDAQDEGSKELSYPEIVNLIVEKDGVIGLLGRGLQTRLLTNALQGAAFSVLWKYFQQLGV